MYVPSGGPIEGGFFCFQGLVRVLYVDVLQTYKYVQEALLVVVLEGA